MINGTLLNFGKRYKDNSKVIFALRFGCAKQSKFFERYLLFIVRIAESC